MNGEVLRVQRLGGHDPGLGAARIGGLHGLGLLHEEQLVVAVVGAHCGEASRDSLVNCEVLIECRNPKCRMPVRECVRDAVFFRETRLKKQLTRRNDFSLAARRCVACTIVLLDMPSNVEVIRFPLS